MNDDEKLILRSRPSEMSLSEDLENSAFNLKIYNEMNFTDANQAVEKNEFDFTCDQKITNHKENTQQESCFFFKGTLQNLNNVFD